MDAEKHSIVAELYAEGAKRVLFELYESCVGADSGHFTMHPRHRARLMQAMAGVVDVLRSAEYIEPRAKDVAFQNYMHKLTAATDITARSADGSQS